MQTIRTCGEILHNVLPVSPFWPSHAAGLSASEQVTSRQRAVSDVAFEYLDTCRPQPSPALFVQSRFAEPLRRVPAHEEV